MGCEYCRHEDQKPVFDDRTQHGRKSDSYPGIDIWVSDEDGGELLVTAVSDTYEPVFNECSVKINYCPMCGRKLNDQTHNQQPL